MAPLSAVSRSILYLNYIGWDGPAAKTAQTWSACAAELPTGCWLNAWAEKPTRLKGNICAPSSVWQHRRYDARSAWRGSASTSVGGVRKRPKQRIFTPDATHEEPRQRLKDHQLEVNCRGLVPCASFQQPSTRPPPIYLQDGEPGLRQALSCRPVGRQ